MTDGGTPDLGSAELDGPPVVEVMSHQTFDLVYRAGPHGIAAGGGLRVGMRHVVTWSPAQFDHPEDEGFVTVAASGGVTVHGYAEYGNTISWTPGFPSVPESSDKRPTRRFVSRHIPWQNLVEVVVDEVLPPGGWIRIRYGDRSSGSPGIRVQPFDETSFQFRVFVDHRGDGGFAPLETSPTVAVVAAEPARLSVVLPSDGIVGVDTWCLVRAEDRYGNPAPLDRAIRLTPDGPVSLRDDEIRLGPDGVVRVPGLVWGAPGVYTLEAEAGDLRARSNPIRVEEDQPDRLLLWGDIHGHTLNSDGRGTVDEFYDFADRVASPVRSRMMRSAPSGSSRW